MKTITFILLQFLLVIGLFAQSLTVDKNLSSVNWKGTKSGGYHAGTIPLKSAQVIFKDGILSGGDFVIDMTGIQVVGDESESDKKDIITDITDKAFFDVQSHKEAKFQISSVNKTSGDDKNGIYEISGLLTIKGISNPISFPANIQKMEGAYKGSAKIKFNRKKWNLGFSGLMGFMKQRVLDDEIEINVSITAK